MNRYLFSRALAAAALLGAGLTGCGGPAPPVAGFESSLTHLSGCADVFLAATNADDSLAVVFQSSGQVATAQSAGKTTTFALTLPSDGVSVHLYQGKGLSASFCTDYQVEGQTRIDADRTAQSGRATLTVTPSSGADQATVLLQNLQFPDGSDTPIALPQLQISNVHVGWFAG